MARLGIHVLSFAQLLILLLLGCQTAFEVAAQSIQLSTEQVTVYVRRGQIPGPRHSSTANIYQNYTIGNSFHYNQDFYFSIPAGTPDEKAKAGYSQGFCYVTATDQTTVPPPPVLDCHISFYFVKDSSGGYNDAIFARGSFAPATTNSDPYGIIGGTGKYATASGYYTESTEPTTVGSELYDGFFFTVYVLTPTVPASTPSAPASTGGLSPVGSPGCSPSGNLPNACYSSDGSVFRCCPGACGSNSPPTCA
eukprot:TRINITY_DN16047_c0_g1_i1.p1 TRINITY_DN16047_c0_g1~~TRINITY_DN16047_c0_g1_i1.p1  ORF type:complete len:251 (-),score=17.16 TRINITY_DN16047_c0_g1_i1:344-1096(-)